MRSLVAHIAAVATTARQQSSNAKRDDTDASIDKASIGKGTDQMFDNIVKLKVGEAFLFAPTAIIGMTSDSGSQTDVKKLGTEFMKIRVRNRFTMDGGKSQMAT